MTEPAPGFQIAWRLECVDCTLAVQVSGRDVKSANLYDFALNKIPVNSLPTDPVGTLQGLSHEYGSRTLQVISPNTGLSTQGRMRVVAGRMETVLTFPRLGRTAPARLQVYDKPVLEFWRLMTVMQEADLLAAPDASLFSSRQYLGSAALERFDAVLAAPETATFPILAEQARARKQQIQQRAESLFSAINEHATAARTTAEADPGAPAVADRSVAAMRAAEQFMREFPGDPRFTAAGVLMDEMRTLRALQSSGPASGPGDFPELDARPIRDRRPLHHSDHEMHGRAVSFAERLMGDARTAYNDGNWLLAWVLADNVAHNFHFTSSAKDAEVLAGSIQHAWEDSDARDAWLASRLPAIQAERVAADPQTAARVAREILVRYPFCPEAPAVRAALRQASGG